VIKPKYVYVMASTIKDLEFKVNEKASEGYRCLSVSFFRPKDNRFQGSYSTYTQLMEYSGLNL
jgi:hypothetical protein